jgi:hypothetical protein
MLETLASPCENPACERSLKPESCMLVYETEAGTRRAYECSCGTVTVTVTR